MIVNELVEVKPYDIPTGRIFAFDHRRANGLPADAATPYDPEDETK